MKLIQPRALAIAVSLALVFAALSGRFLRPLLQGSLVARIDHGTVLAISLADLAVMVLAIVVVGRADLRTVVKFSGLTAPIGRPLLFALALFAPAAIACALGTDVAADPSLGAYAWGAVGAPFFEELGFRGLAIGALMHLGGWRFWPAALLPALLFGLAHLGQANAPAEVAGVVAITGLGGAFFGWLYVRWSFNLWPALFVHAGLNGLWLTFDLGHNAVGGWLGNVVRVLVIIGAIGLTVTMAPRPPTARAR